MFLWCCGSSSGSPAVALRLGEIVSRGSALYAQILVSVEHTAFDEYTDLLYFTSASFTQLLHSHLPRDTTALDPLRVLHFKCVSSNSAIAELPLNIPPGSYEVTFLRAKPDSSLSRLGDSLDLLFCQRGGKIEVRCDGEQRSFKRKPQPIKQLFKAPPPMCHHRPLAPPSDPPSFISELDPMPEEEPKPSRKQLGSPISQKSWGSTAESRCPSYSKLKGVLRFLDASSTVADQQDALLHQHGLSSSYDGVQLAALLPDPIDEEVRQAFNQSFSAKTPVFQAESTCSFGLSKTKARPGRSQVQSQFSPPVEELTASPAPKQVETPIIEAAALATSFQRERVSQFWLGDVPLLPRKSEPVGAELQRLIAKIERPEMEEQEVV